MRCILLLILSKMLKRLESDDNAKRQAIINDLKRLVHINDEKNQLLIHMACQKVFFSLCLIDYFIDQRNRVKLLKGTMGIIFYYLIQLGIKLCDLLFGLIFH